MFTLSKYTKKLQGNKTVQQWRRRLKTTARITQKVLLYVILGLIILSVVFLPLFSLF